MKRPILSALALLLAAAGAAASDYTVSSPDGQTSVVLSDEQGKLTYRVTHCGVEAVAPSPLGLATDIGNLSEGVSIASFATADIRESYDLRTIKQSHVDYAATEAVCRVTSGKAAMDVIFRVGNHDVAFRYRIHPLPNNERLCCAVTSEASGFQMPAATTTFLCPQSKPMGGFARTTPSYETPYTVDAPTGLNGNGEGYTFPCLFKVTAAQPGARQKTPTTVWVLVSETGTDANYCACRLIGHAGGLYTVGFPQAAEGNGDGSVAPSMSLPGETPWRTITLGTTLAPIVETTVPFDLVRPKYEGKPDYVYGRGTWSWIIADDQSCNFAEQKRYIDFAADMSYQSVLIDAQWDQQIGRERIAELADYGRGRGVALYLWYNSNGSWNDAPQTPRNIMSDPIARRREMRWMQQTGIRGIKVDFFGGDKQQMMRLYEEILADAAEHDILVIFHGCTLPRGWERMYPNYVASEAVLASENLRFSQRACESEAFCATIHPFVRNAVGSMDFGGSALNKHYSADNRRGTRRVTSDVYALATAVLFQSPVQHFALAPNNLTDAPAWAVGFMKTVPTTWDEVRYIAGYPGRYAVIARRSGAHWYVAGINAQDSPVEQTLALPMLQPGAEATLYADDAQLNGSRRTLKVGRRGQVKVSIPKNGAFLIVQ